MKNIKCLLATTKMKTPNIKYLTAGLAFFVLNVQLHAQLSFAPAVDYDVGITPHAVVTADVNGDGNVDLISANQYANTLTVLTNNGGGGFGSNATLNVGSYPLSVTAADVNGDGNFDLVSANGSDSSLSIFTNNCIGGFMLKATVALSVNSAPGAMACADIDDDGKADLICATAGYLGLTVLTNDGSGGFVIKAIPPVGSRPASVKAADVNGDGKVDLVSVGGSGELTVLTNNGSGDFVFSSAPPIVGASVVAADVNGNGKVDLVGADGYGDTLTVLTNTGSGGFAQSSSQFVSSSGSITAANINVDGKADLIYPFANFLIVMTNNGSGGFSQANMLAVGSYPASVSLVITADANSDGKEDLIYALNGSNTLSVILNTSSPLFASVNTNLLTDTNYTFIGPTNVSLATGFPNGSIFYTLDGSEPDFGSHFYQSPFVVGRSSLLRAVAYSADFLQSGEMPPIAFNIIPVYGINYLSSPGGNVSANPSANTYQTGVSVNLQATPNAGWKFLNWLGDCSGSNTNATLTMDMGKAVQAVFGTTFGTTITGNGTVTVDPVSGWYPYGTTVRLTLIPPPAICLALGATPPPVSTRIR